MNGRAFAVVVFAGLAVTNFGGLISSTLLDMFLTPVLFLKFGKRPVKRLRAGCPLLTAAEAF